ncbi:MAG: DUF4926 domain-containing protein [Gemmatimonadota bacterium]
MIEELDSVALTRNLPEHGLERGDVGKVVFRYDTGEAFEVEFLAGDGSTLAVLTLETDEVRPLERTDTFHVRSSS